MDSFNSKKETVTFAKYPVGEGDSRSVLFLHNCRFN